MKIDVRIVYGKTELAPREINWLRSLAFVRTSFCQHLHAKCYLNEGHAIITSMNLYDFSQVNNNEMGVLIYREHEPDMYRDTFEEAQRLIRISEEVRLSAEQVSETPETAADDGSVGEGDGGPAYEKLTTSRLAKALGLRSADLTDKLIRGGLVVREGDQLKLTDRGREAGGEFRFSPKFGPYFLWPANLKP